MTNKQKNKLLCVDDLRHAEYYQMQDVFDELYTKSKSGEVFTELMPLILQEKTFCSLTAISKPTAEVKRTEQITW